MLNETVSTHAVKYEYRGHLPVEKCKRTAIRLLFLKKQLRLGTQKKTKKGAVEEKESPWIYINMLDKKIMGPIILLYHCSSKRDTCTGNTNTIM